MISLDRLANVLGGYGVRLACCPIPRSTELSSIALAETLDGKRIPGDVLLAVGAESTAQAVEWAVAANAAVVLARDDGSAPASSSAAVMLIDAALSWSEMAAAVYGLVLEGRETESGRGPTDLFALADTLATQFGADVLITDRHGDVAAYSSQERTGDSARVSTILARRHPGAVEEMLRANGVLAHLQTSDSPLFVAPADEHGFGGRMAVAARAGREPLGTVWVVTPEPLTGTALSALVYGSHAVALHLLRSRASADLERQVESDLVRRLLDGDADADTLVSRLGLPTAGLRAIAVRATLRDDRHAGLLLAFERATAGFGWSRPGRSALAESAVYTVLSAEKAEAARQWLEALSASLPDAVTVWAGISGTATPSELRTAREEADECLALHESAGGTAPPAYDESWDDVVLRRLRAVAHSGRTPQRGPVAELREHDRRHGTQYVETLQAFLAAQGDPGAAAAHLGVHENTVRYRMRKMAEVTDLPLNDARKRLAMMVELTTTE